VTERPPTAEELEELREAGYLLVTALDGVKALKAPGPPLPWHEALRIEHEVVDLDEDERRG
jgi:hypothetical protein